ncbi:hypothetical protein CPB84DRAFT_1433976 [Gymnopilus junonius]|uniref:FBD domain-containing protein n=1 Tax=Gymnopilus junonius TaxID=109634 RepID=A0A9P5NX16_GYMJU|nr:hypothetical protein CPB84DRAFT_1433976 [Gymnopilus junonius]
MLDWTSVCSSRLFYSGCLCSTHASMAKHRISLPFPSFPALSVIRGPLPMLEHACVYTEEQTGRVDNEVQRILNCIYTSPRLRSASWASGVINGGPKYYPQTLPNITNLGMLSRLTCVHDVFAILRACPQLQVLTLTAARCDRQNCPAIVQMVHGKLQTLQIRGVGLDLGEIYHYLSLPSLKSLEIGLDRDPSRWLYHHLLSFFDRSRCRLQKFRFRSYGRSGFTEQELRALFICPSFQSLEELVIWQEEITSACINLLNLDSPNPLMPRLVHLELSKCVAQDNVLGSMLVSRRRGNRGPIRQLESVKFGQKSTQKKLINMGDKGIFKNLVATVCEAGLHTRELTTRMWISGHISSISADLALTCG